MVIEIEFATSLDCQAALDKATEFLRIAAFEPGMGTGLSAQALADLTAAGVAPSNSPPGTTLEMHRGSDEFPDPARCLQQIQVEFADGRVSISGAILPRIPPTFLSSFISSFISFDSINDQYKDDVKADSKLGKPYADLMTTLSRTLQALLADQAPINQAIAPWQQMEADLAEQRRRSSKISDIVIITIGLLVLGFIGWVLWGYFH